MKDRIFFWGGIAVAAVLFHGCTDDGNPDPDGGQGNLPAVVEEVISVMEETVPEAGHFIEMLKQADLSDVTSEEITVFAVRNAAEAKSVAIPDLNWIRRHIVEGSHAGLADGQQLVSLSGETLLISVRGDGTVSVNGVPVSGSAIPAGKSCIYIVEDIIPAPEISDENAMETWRSVFEDFCLRTRTLNQKLAYGYDGFSYTDVKTVSDEYWSMAYRAVETGLSLVSALSDGEGTDVAGSTAVQEIRLGMTLIYSDILGFYGQFVYMGNDEPHSDVNALLEELNMLEEYVAEDYSGAVRAVSARVALNSIQDYELAFSKCMGMIESGKYALPEDNVFATDINPGVVWPGFEDTDAGLAKGTYYHPVRYEEVLLMAAEAVNELGRPMDAMQFVNQIAVWKGMPDMVTPAPTKDEISECIRTLFSQDLKSESLEYSTWRRWGIMDDMLQGKGGYSSHNALLPVPESALDQYLFLTQNGGYQ